MSVVLSRWSVISVRMCWVAPHRPASLAVVQPQDQRKGLETATETSVVYWTGDLTRLKQRVLEQHPTVYSRWQARHGSHLGYSGEKEAAIYRGTDVRLAHQSPGKPAAGARPSPPLRLMTITITRADVSL